MDSKAKSLKGYKAGRMSEGTFRKSYVRAKSIARFKKTGTFKNRGNGSGHLAGEQWAQKKEIDPSSQVRRYSKNSPSFDEGVYRYKQGAKVRAFQNELLGRMAK